MNKIIENNIMRKLLLIIFSFYLIVKIRLLFENSTIATYILYVCCIIYFLYELLFDKERLRNKQLLLSFIIVLFPIIPFLINESTYYWSIIRYCMPLFVNFCILFPAKKSESINTYIDESKISLMVLFIASTIICVLSIGQYIYDFCINILNNNVIKIIIMHGIVGNSNYMAFYLLPGLGIGYLIYRFIANEKYKKIIRAIIVLHFICLLLGRCRSAYIGLFVFSMCLLIINKKFVDLYKKHKAAVLVTTILLIFTFFILVLFVIKKGSDGRIDILYYGLVIFKQCNILIGKGAEYVFGFFSNAANDLIKNGIDNENLRVYVSTFAIHNAFAHAMFMNGIIYLLLLVVFFVFILIRTISIYKILINAKNANRISRKNLIFLLLCLYFIIVGFFVSCFEDRVLIECTTFVNYTMFLFAGYFMNINKEVLIENSHG